MTFTARLLLLLTATALLAQAPPPPDPFAQANAFAAAYNDWGHRYEQRVKTLGATGFDAAEKRSFDRLSEQWTALRKSMRLQYAQ